MFFISFPILWSFSYFFLFIYTIVIFSIILYALPTLKNSLNYSFIKNKNTFFYLSGFDLYLFMLTPLFLLLILHFSWSSNMFLVWFGNLIFTGFQYKIFFFFFFFFIIIISVYSSSFYFSSKEVYDYIITCFNFFYWLFFLFSANTLFTFIFFIEILSTLIFLLLITSTFSTLHFYNNLNLNLHNYFNQTTPFFFIQMLIYFFLNIVNSFIKLIFFFNFILYKILNFWLVYFWIYFFLHNKLLYFKRIFFYSTNLI